MQQIQGTVLSLALSLDRLEITALAGWVLNINSYLNFVMCSVGTSVGLGGVWRIGFLFSACLAGEGQRVFRSPRFCLCRPASA